MGREACAPREQSQIQTTTTTTTTTTSAPGSPKLQGYLWPPGTKFWGSQWPLGTKIWGSHKNTPLKSVFCILVYITEDPSFLEFSPSKVLKPLGLQVSCHLLLNCLGFWISRSRDPGRPTWSVGGNCFIRIPLWWAGLFNQITVWFWWQCFRTS